MLPAYLKKYEKHIQQKKIANNIPQLLNIMAHEEQLPSKAKANKLLKMTLYEISRDDAQVKAAKQKQPMLS